MKNHTSSTLQKCWNPTLSALQLSCFPRILAKDIYVQLYCVSPQTPRHSVILSQASNQTPCMSLLSWLPKVGSPVPGVWQHTPQLMKLVSLEYIMLSSCDAAYDSKGLTLFWIFLIFYMATNPKITLLFDHHRAFIDTLTLSRPPLGWP